MNPPASATARASGTGATPGSAADEVQRLRGLLRGAELSEVSAVLDGLSVAVDRMATEHAGLAEELLGVYEQLGIVFEVSRALSGTHGDAHVINVFVDSLSHSFAHGQVFPVRPVAGGGWQTDRSDENLPAWLEPLLDRVREQAGVVVAPSPEAVDQAQISEAMIGPVFSGQDFVCAIILTRGASVPEFRASDMQLLESLATFCGDVIGNHRLVGELRRSSLALVSSLVSAVDQKDTYTSGHSVRVSFYALMLGRSWNLDDEAMRMLRWSALLHDVGKIGIRDEVLKKPGKLTPEEFDHIKEHPVRSHQVVRNVPQLSGALDGVLYHHEHFDGTGYPEGLQGEQIPLQARIVQVADVFDALTSTRSYRSAHGWRKALDILEQEAGRTLDPELQRRFSQLIHEALDDQPGAWEEMTRRAEGSAGSTLVAPDSQEET